MQRRREQNERKRATTNKLRKDDNLNK